MGAPPGMKASRSPPSIGAALEKDLRDWWNDQERAFERLLQKPRGKDDSDLWNDMPTIDSKAVALTLPIFEKHLGIPLDVKLIAPGGYETIDELISDLVPKMLDAARHAADKSEGNE